MAPQVATQPQSTEAATDLGKAVLGSPDKAVSLAISHVVDQVQSGKTALTDVQIQSLRKLIEQHDKPVDSVSALTSKASGIEAQKQAFIEKYGIKVLAESQVALILPEGTSRIELLKEAQKLAKKLHGSDAIWPDRLSNWTEDAAFTAKVGETLKLAVDGNVKGSTNQTRSEQESKGWNNVDLKDLAVANAAYFIATGKDLFDGNVVRARGGALRFSGGGLDVSYSYGAFRSRYVSASRSLPFPN